MFSELSAYADGISALSRSLNCASEAERQQIHAAALRIEEASAWLLGKGFNEHSLEQELEMAARYVPSPSIIFDVGASVGRWSQQALARFPSARVIAFEPQAANRAVLELMAVAEPRLTFKAMAVSDEIGEATIYRDRDGSQLASLHHRDLTHHHLAFEQTETVCTTTLRQQFEEVGAAKIDILKIDVEGHEMAVLRSAGDLLQRASYIQFEFGGTMIDSRTFFKDAFDLLTGYSFSVFRITPHGLLKLERYREELETFVSCNYVAIYRNAT